MLETLINIDEIGGFKIIRDKPTDMSWNDFDKLRKDYPINITDRVNCISFRIQDGPVKENGLNGCQVDTIIETAKLMIEGLNVRFPCRENSLAITKLEEALLWLDKRKKDRIKRNVEGTNQA